MRRAVTNSVILSLLLAGLVADAADAGRRNRRLAERGRGSAARGIPAHPDQLRFEPLSYEAPRGDAHRHELSNGVVAYVVEDHDLPLVDVTIQLRAGAYLDPPGKEGLAAMTTSLMRTGGAGAHDAEAFDEEIAFLAVNLSIGADDRESTASLNVLSKDLEAGLDLLFMALREPRFQQDRIDLYRRQVVQALERRNDRTTGIERREWLRLMYGDSFVTRASTVPSVQSLTREDLQAFHRRTWLPQNFLVGVAGDVDTASVLAELEERMADWWEGQAAPPATPPTHRPGPGVFVVNKDDVNQTRVSIGHLATTWDDPRWAACEIMNEILGGGGFISRITRRVRSDEGLAYSAGSVWGFGRDYPRSFRAAFQSKNEAVPRAISIVLEELERIRNEPITEDELETAQNSFVETFPRRFASAGQKVGVFMEDELHGRPADWWARYRPALQAVTAADVQAAARELLHPDRVTILVVGKIDEVMAGDPDHPEHRLSDHAGAAGILDIGLPDPETLVYPHPPRPLPMPAVEASGQ